jgi:hypothetical protein
MDDDTPTALLAAPRPRRQREKLTEPVRISRHAEALLAEQAPLLSEAWWNWLTETKCPS